MTSTTTLLFDDINRKVSIKYVTKQTFHIHLVLVNLVVVVVVQDKVECRQCCERW